MNLKWHDVIYNILDFIVMYVIVKGVLAHWLMGIIDKWFKKMFLRTEKEWELFIKYRDKASRHRRAALAPYTNRRSE